MRVRKSSRGHKADQMLTTGDDSDKSYGALTSGPLAADYRTTYSVMSALHQYGNWGSVCDRDAAENNRSMNPGFQDLELFGH